MLASEALAAFKRDYWHRQIKLFRAAINFSDYPIRTTKLLSLAANDRVESRLINANYEVQHGPIMLNSLAEQNILILHSLESHIDSTEALLRQEFSFLPAWQIDDVMASIGNHNASCGPHFRASAFSRCWMDGFEKRAFRTVARIAPIGLGRLGN